MFRFPFCLAALLLSSAASAATETAPIEVSLTVRESCLIERSDASHPQAPTVSCSLDSPYRVQRATAGRIAARMPAAPATLDTALWEVTF